MSVQYKVGGKNSWLKTMGFDWFCEKEITVDWLFIW